MQERTPIIKAYGLDLGDTPFDADSLETLNEHLERGYQALWLDIESPTSAALESIREHFDLDAESIDDCLAGDQRPRIDEFEDKLFLVVYGAAGVQGDREFSPNKIAMFWNRKFLITVHHAPSLTLRTLQKSFHGNSGHLLRRGLDHLLYLVLDQLVDYFMAVVDGCDDRINELDDQVFTEPLAAKFMEHVNDLRRDLVEMRRIAVSQRELLYPVATGQYEMIREELEPRFSHVVDHLTKTIEIIDGLREVLHGVRDNYQAALSLRLNRIMHVLTVFASLFMPLTFIVGVYGMNMVLWPDMENPLTFWGLMLVMLCVAGGMLAYFKTRKWL